MGIYRSFHDMSPKEIRERDAKMMALRGTGLSYGKILKEMSAEYPDIRMGIVAGVLYRAKLAGEASRPITELSTKTEKIMALWHSGLKQSAIVESLRDEFPDIHVGQVKGACSRARKRGIKPRGTGRGQSVVPFVLPAALPDTGGLEGRERRRRAFEHMVDSRGCKFPIGDPHSPEFRFCCAAKAAESAYCDHHHRITHHMPVQWLEAAE